MAVGVIEPKPGPIEQREASDGVTTWMEYRLFPYERRLGLRELESLGLRVGDVTDTTVQVEGDPSYAVRRGTYFATVVGSGGDAVVTHQALVEGAHHRRLDHRHPRQATRYGLHGIHEYKGKFNPQVVRALINVLDPDADMLIDPFCGSGTALIEGLRLDMRVVGIDHSPLASFLSHTKLEATTAPSPAAVARAVSDFAERCAAALDAGQSGGAPALKVRSLNNAAHEYLINWFTSPAYAGLTRALALLDETRSSIARSLTLVALSSILRQASLQLPEDLRIRRRPLPFVAPPLGKLLLTATDRIRSGLLEVCDWPELRKQWVVAHGTAESAAPYQTVGSARRRLVLTSPPYATALPYIDTDRLSLVALGLADAAELQHLERSLIGSREWTRREHTQWDQRRLANADALPVSITSITARIEEQNRDTTAGFRRLAVPSLLYRYFARMGAAMSRWHQVLASGEFAVLIVGHNHTTAGPQRIAIPTPALLGDLAEARGFAVSEILELEAWPRYGLHAANGVHGEDALVIRRVP